MTWEVASQGPIRARSAHFEIASSPCLILIYAPTQKASAV